MVTEGFFAQRKVGGESWVTLDAEFSPFATFMRVKNPTIVSAVPTLL